MRNRFLSSTIGLTAVITCSSVMLAQSGSKAGAANSKAAGAFDPHDLSGKWNRTSPFQTYSNVPGGANELQAYILGQESAPRKLNVPTAEAPFTPEGKAQFDKNIPSYGRRITAPVLGNDPQGNCSGQGTDYGHPVTDSPRRTAMKIQL